MARKKKSSIEKLFDRYTNKITRPINKVNSIFDDIDNSINFISNTFSYKPKPKNKNKSYGK